MLCRIWQFLPARTWLHGGLVALASIGTGIAMSPCGASAPTGGASALPLDGTTRS